MSKYKLEFKLKQHTPLIHFQGEQYGATLRATELKPKLDRFLIDNCKLTEVNDRKKEVAKDEYKLWFTSEGKQHLALDYTVRIICNNCTSEPAEYHVISKGEVIERKSSLPMFFANMGEDWEKSPKYFVFSNSIKVVIRSEIEGLRSAITSNFDNFVFSTNFGTRQSKGFGSFSTTNIPNINELNFAQIYKFTIDLTDNTFRDIRHPNVSNPSENFIFYGKLFEILDIFSKTYRSGINFGGYYFKSLMYMYAKKCGHTWDKKYFKSKFLGSEHYKIIEQNKNHNNPEILNFDELDNEYLLRDLLGLSTEQKWDNNLTISHKKVNGKNINEVKRYRSPITYKIIQDENNTNKFDIYLLVECIDKNVLNKSFTITNNKKDITINTPKNWRIDKFLNFCFSFAIENHPIKKDKDNNIVPHTNDKHHKVISYIYKKLQPKGVQS